MTVSLDVPLKKLSGQLDHIEAAIKNLPTLDAIQLVRSQIDSFLGFQYLDGIAAQAAELRSHQRLYTVNVIRFCDETSQSDEAVLSLLQACIFVGRYRDVLSLTDQFSPLGDKAILLRAEAAYRIGLWKEVTSLFCAKEEVSLPVFTQIQIARAAIEIRNIGLASSIANHLAAAKHTNVHSLSVLYILLGFRSGRTTPELLDWILKEAPLMQPAEAACILRFLETAALSVETANLGRAWHPLLAHLWGVVGQVKHIMGPSGAIHRCSKEDRKNTIAVAIRGDSTLQFMQAIEICKALRQESSNYVVSLVSMRKLDRQACAFEIPLIELEGHSYWEMLGVLREKEFGILIDQVSVSDPRWLEVVAQRIAPIQILWSDYSINYLPTTAPYEIQIADRWTTPETPPAGTVPWLTLPGVRCLIPSSIEVLNHYSTVSRQLNGRSLIVLGGPERLLPGAAKMISECFAKGWFTKALFLSKDWGSKEAVQEWLKYWKADDIVEDQHPIGLLDRPSDMPTGGIAVDLGLNVSSEDILQSIIRGIPVVGLLTGEASSRNVLSVMSALGLATLVRNQPDEWLAVVEALATDEETYASITDSMIQAVPQSLLMDATLLASSLLSAIDIAVDSPKTLAN